MCPQPSPGKKKKDTRSKWNEFLLRAEKVHDNLHLIHFIPSIETEKLKIKSALIITQYLLFQVISSLVSQLNLLNIVDQNVSCISMVSPLQTHHLIKLLFLIIYSSTHPHLHSGPLAFTDLPLVVLSISKPMVWNNLQLRKKKKIPLILGVAVLIKWDQVCKMLLENLRLMLSGLCLRACHSTGD